jgi:hypothetical protein
MFHPMVRTCIMQAAADRLSGGSFVIMALAPAVSSQLQDRRFGTLLDSGSFSLPLGLTSPSSALAWLQPGNVSDVLKPDDGGRRGMAKKGLPRKFSLPY